MLLLVDVHGKEEDENKAHYAAAKLKAYGALVQKPRAAINAKAVLNEKIRSRFRDAYPVIKNKNG